MQAMTQFNFHTHAIRVFPTDDGSSFFAVAADVAKVLGFSKANDFTRNIPEKHKGAHKVRTIDRGYQEMQVVDEAGLYYGTLRSNRPEAEPFVEWVTTEVLPSIRRTGAYVHPAAADNGAAQMSLAREIGNLRDQVQAQNGVILHLYNRLDGAQRGHIRAVVSLMGLQKRQAARDAKEMVIFLEAQGVARAEISARTGKTLNHIRQIVRNARLAGRLPRQGELDLDSRHD
ncbi:MAG: BRO family protein [Azonexus sp.]